MKRHLLLLCIVSCIVSAPCWGQNPNSAVFPSTAATDADLGVAKDGAQSTLAASINSSQTTFTITTSGAFRQYSFISINSEIMQVCSYSGTSVTVCSRGASGTTAASHASGAPVRNNVAAHYINQLAAEVKAVEDDLKNRGRYCADAGSNDTYACSLSPTPSYATGAHYFFKANTANTGAATINFNSLGAKTIKKPGTSGLADLGDNDIRAGQIIEVAYDGTYMQMVSGPGSVTHTTGALDADAFVTGNSGGDIKTPSATSTLDSSGNASFAGGVDAAGSVRGGVGSGFAGALELPCGTVPASWLSNALAIYAPAGPCTAYRWVWPASDPGAGYVYSNGSATPSSVTTVPASGLYCADAGANDTYACTLSPSIASYTTGVHYLFKANTANTGAATINFNSLGAKTIKKAVGGVTTDLSDNDIRAGQVVEVAYDGTNMQMLSILGNATVDAPTVGAALYCADGGSNDTYACSLSPAISSYTTGAHYLFKANTANTGAATINLNSLGAKTIKKAVGGVTTSLDDNDIRAGQVVEVAYDGTNMQMLSILGNAASGSTVDAPTVGAALYCADSGSNDTYACDLSPSIGSYTTGAHYLFKANTANTGAATINLNSVGAKTIKKAAGGVTTDLDNNDIRAGQVVELAYDGTNMQMLSLLGNAPSGGGSTVDAPTVGAALYCADAGASDAYACSLSPSLSSYTAGEHYLFKANTANTGAATLNLNSIGAKTIKKAAGGVTTDLDTNDIRAGQIVEVAYDGTNMQMLSLLGNAPSAATSGLVLVEQHTASASTELDFTSCISSTYDQYEIELVNLLTNTSATDIEFQASTNGGSSYDTGNNYEWNHWVWVSGGTGQLGANATSYIALFSRNATTSNWTANGSYTLFNPGGSGYKLLKGQGVHLDTTSIRVFGVDAIGAYLSTTAVNAFRLLPSSGNFTSGTVRCYGLAK